MFGKSLYLCASFSPTYVSISPSPDLRKADLRWKKRLVRVCLSLFFFWVAIDVLSYAFQHWQLQTVEELLTATSNPAVAFCIGLLATAVLQSSSTSTALMVAMVGVGSLHLQQVVPMLMGANIGTTFTSTLVAIGHVSRPAEFRQALAAATAHDFFNLLTAAVLLPLELVTGGLSWAAWASAAWFHGVFNLDIFWSSGLDTLVFPTRWGTLPAVHPLLLICGAGVLLYVAVQMLASTVRHELTGPYRRLFRQSVFGSHWRALGWGTGLTALAHSSSLLTSLVVPLAATGKVPLARIFSFLVGANLGTTFTALLAALFRSEAALAVALAHLFFNLTGAALFFPFTRLRQLPLWLAEGLGSLSLRYRMTGFLYLVSTFFVVPFLLILLSQRHDPSARPVVERQPTATKWQKR